MNYLTPAFYNKLNFFYTFSILFLLFGLNTAHAQSIKINEVMASNASSKSDEDGDNPDWIELYNAGQSEVNLLNFGLSDNYAEPFKWILPNVTLQAGQFLVIYASGKDRKESFSFLHTNFKISADGEEVLLTHPDGVLVDEMSPVQIPTDYSYGRKPDGGESLKFFTDPTPNASNTSSGFSSFAPTPVFSHTGGFYEGEFDLTISSSDPEATIIYTMDGSVPDPDNLSGTTFTYKNQYPEEPGSSTGPLLYTSYKSMEYSGPVPIKDRSSEADEFTRISSTYDGYPNYFPGSPVFKGTVIKARVIKPDAVPSEIVANTFFVTGQGINRYSLPVISLSASPEALFGYENGIYVAGQDFDRWRNTNTWGRPDGGTPANYKRSGVEWEVPAHIEVFNGEQGRVLSQGLGIRIHGGWTRSYRAKSLRLYARNEYGESRFNYPVFPDQPYDSYKRLVIRNSGNDFGYSMFRDAAIHAMVDHLDIETMAYRPAVLFLNSEYWGIHNFRERYDKHYFERKYGADPDNIDILEANMGVVEGDADHYRETIQYIESNSLRDEQHYNYIRDRIDVENFIDYQIVQIYVGNADWPGNNIKYWRSKTSSADPATARELDGRWRWLLYDTDFGFSLYNSKGYEQNMLEFATEPRGPGWPNPPWSTFLLRKLLENNSFRNDFINRFSDQLNTAFKPAVVKSKIATLKNELEPEIEEHILRWEAPQSMSAWERSVNAMVDFVDFRPNYQWNHLKNFFRLEGDYQLSVDISQPESGFVRVNSLELQPGTEGLSENVYPWKGKYFKGVPVEVEAIPAPGYYFFRWEGIESSSPTITVDPDADVSVVAVFRQIVSGLEEEEEKELEVTIYPNPVEEEANLKISMHRGGYVQVSLLDLTGKLYAEVTNGMLSSGDHYFPIDTRNLSPGIYVVRCQLENEQVYQKLVK